MNEYLSLVFFGASNFFQFTQADDDSNNTFVGDEAFTIFQTGINSNVGINTKAVSGSRVYREAGDNGAVIATQVTEFLAQTNGSELIYNALIHGDGNNISAFGDFENWTQEQRDGVAAAHEAVLTRLINSGRVTVWPMPPTFRMYTADSDILALTRQDRASVVYDQLLKPIDLRLAPHAFDENENPIIDTHAESLRLHQEGIYFEGNFGDPDFDGIHGTRAGGRGILNYIVSKINEIRSNTSYFNASDKISQEVVTYTVSTGTSQTSVLHNSNRSVGPLGTISPLRDIEGNSIAGSQVSISGFTSASNTGVPQESAISTYPRAYNYHPTVATHYAAGTGQANVAVGVTGEVLMTLGPRFANETVKYQIASARDISPTNPDDDVRLTNFTLQGLGNPVAFSINSTAVPPRIAAGNVTLDETGSVRISFTPGPNNTRGGYFSSATLIADRTITFGGSSSINVTENLASSYAVDIANTDIDSIVITAIDADTLEQILPEELEFLVSSGEVKTEYFVSIPAIDFEQHQQIRLTISASNTYETKTKDVLVRVNNIFENSIVSPFEDGVTPTISVGEDAELTNQSPQLTTFLASSNATGLEVFVISSTQIRVTLTLDDAEPLAQLINVTRVPTPKISVLPARVESGMSLAHPVTIRDFNGVPEASRGQLVNIDGPRWNLILDPYDAEVTTSDQITIFADDGVNGEVTEILNVEIYSNENSRGVPDLYSSAVVVNPLSGDNVSYINPTRNNPVYIEFIDSSNKVIDFRSATRFQLKRADGTLVVDTVVNSEAVTAKLILDRNGRQTPVVEFKLPAETAQTISGEALIFVVFDSAHEDGQVVVHPDESELSFILRSS